MPRIALEVAYEGTGFQGSQGQTRPGARTVDSTLKDGLESLLGQRPKLLWASRTDSGVHAMGNVCAFDAQLPLPAARLPDVLKARLPVDLRVLRAQAAAADFHPRFDALERSYRYRFCHSERDPALWRCAWCVEPGLDMQAMRQAAALFSGEGWYSAFAEGSLEREQSRCIIRECRITELPGDSGMELWISANRFLRHMVCRIAGAVLAAGQGRISLADLGQALNDQKRLRFKPAPPRGLTLMKVTYQDKLG